MVFVKCLMETSTTEIPSFLDNDPRGRPLSRVSKPNNALIYMGKIFDACKSCPEDARYVPFEIP